MKVTFDEENRELLLIPETNEDEIILLRIDNYLLHETNFFIRKMIKTCFVNTNQLRVNF